MRVLLIAYHFPPDPAVGAIRAGRIARSLVAAGHHVQVLSIAGEGLPGSHEYDGVRVTRVRKAFDARRALVGLKGLVMRSGTNGMSGKPGHGSLNSAETAIQWQPPTQVPIWRRYLGSLLWLPDAEQGWIPSIVATGLRRIATGVDLIYSTAPPFSAHIAGLMLSSLTRVRWVAELRDPWFENPWKPWYVRSRGTDRIDAWLERSCMMRADRVVAVTGAAARQIAARVADPDSVVLIRNGIPSAPARGDMTPVVPSGEKRTIVYLGTLYHRRDPRPFLEALAELRRGGRLPPAEVEFIGNCTHYQGQDLAAFCAQLGLSDMVRFLPPIPHEECQERIRAADLLLLLAQEQPSQVPQKLYEYLATGRPVIAFADEEGETAEMLREVGGHHLITSFAAENVAEVLASALAAVPGPSPAGAHVLNEWSADTQMERLVKVLEEVGA